MNKNITGNNNVHTPAEREALGLTGRLPSGVLTLDASGMRREFDSLGAGRA